jgi:peptidoglycan/xylan/chitin deacetylase (PgdA/CDA1 family)
MKKIASLFLLLLSLAVAATAQITAADPALSFGSEAILQGLWSLQELQGKPEDKIIHHLRIPDHQPPAREIPTEPLPPLPREWQNSIRRVKPRDDRKLIAFTFDLCERANEITGYDAAIVNVLRQSRVKATFFAGGKWMRSHPQQTMQLMADPLFEIGNHAWTHGNFARLNRDSMLQQILWTQAQYEFLWEQLRKRVLDTHIDPREMDKIPRQPRLFRPPYGRCRAEALDILAKQRLPAIQWDIVSADPVKSRTPAMLMQTVVSEAKPGAIVVMHGNGRGYSTAQALPAIINALRTKGYEFVTVSELLRSGEVVTTQDCYEEKPGDNVRYDRIFGEGTGE